MLDVLIVEDDEVVARALGTLLIEGGFAPVIFHTATAALGHIGLIKPSRPAAAVLDIHLPDLNGLVLSQRLREALGPEMPIIILSGDTSMENINALPFVGATYFLSKPVNAGFLIERLTELTGGTEVKST